MNGSARVTFDDPQCWNWPIPPETDDDPSDQLADFHSGRCGICGSLRASKLDHDHRSGLVRGWLCRSCNLKEGHADGPTDIFARWRAVPSAAMPGVLIPYRSGFAGTAGFDETKWFGFLYRPDHAPDAHGWPYAVTCSAPAVVETDGSLTLPCEHDHDAAVRNAVRSMR
jgi:hypothetical protein